MGRRRLPPRGDGPGPQGQAGPTLTEYHRFVRILGRKVRYEDTGQGPTVLLLHGIGHSLRNWSRTVPALVDAGFRAISIDMPGFGYSEPLPEALDEQATTAFLEAFLDTFYLDQVDLVGHSLGGAIATVFALNRPARLRRLALVAAAVGPDISPTLRLLALQIARPLLRPFALRQVFQLLASSWDEEILEQEVRDAERWLSDPAARIYFWNVLRAGLRLRGVRPERLLLERLPELKMAVLVAWGKDDQVVYFSNVAKVRARLPGAQYAVYEKAGHMLPYEVAKQFNRDLINFLQS